MIEDKKAAKRRYSQKYRAANKEKLREYDARYRAENPDKVRERHARYRAENPDKLRKRSEKWRAENPDKEREIQLKYKYGLSPGQWNAMFLSQGSRCAICSSEVPQSQNGWSTDHCHRTNKVRGILCQSCNVLLGMAKDKVGTLVAATNYLERHQNPNIKEVQA